MVVKLMSNSQLLVKKEHPDLNAKEEEAVFAVAEVDILPATKKEDPLNLPRTPAKFAAVDMAAAVAVADSTVVVVPLEALLTMPTTTNPTRMLKASPLPNALLAEEVDIVLVVDLDLTTTTLDLLLKT